MSLNRALVSLPSLGYATTFAEGGKLQNTVVLLSDTMPSCGHIGDVSVAVNGFLFLHLQTGLITDTLGDYVVIM